MAIRRLRYDDDPILRVKCKPVKDITPSLKKLISDMFDTMYKSNGVGLAAPQIGIVKQLVVIDDYDGHKYVLINPQIISEVGEQLSTEGCLSIPGYYGKVNRPSEIKVRAIDENGKQIEIKGAGMLAIILSHEIDHLDGILYKDKAIEFSEVHKNEDDEEGDEEQ